MTWVLLSSLFCDATLRLTITQPIYVSPHSILTLVPLTPIFAAYQTDLRKSSYESHCSCLTCILMQFKCPTWIAKAHATLFLQFCTNYCWHLAYCALMYSHVPLQSVLSSTHVHCNLSGGRFLCLPCLCVCLRVWAHVTSLHLYYILWFYQLVWNGGPETVIEGDII